MFRTVATSLLMLVCLTPAMAQVPLDETKPAYGVRVETHLSYRLLINGQFLQNGGFSVTYVDPNGPGAWMGTGDRQRAILEFGDVVTAINGNRLKVPADYYTELNKAAQQKGKVTVTVWDVRTRREYTYTAAPARVRVIDQPTTPPIANRATAVKILLVGLTDDQSIGAPIQVSVNKLKTMFTHIPGYDATRHLQVITGKDVTAANILRAVERMPVGTNESFMVYYIGHGAYDAGRANGDPSFGHHFQIPSGDLMRKTLLDTMKKKNARFTVLMSDTCNVASIANPAPKFYNKEVPSGANWVLGNLLLDPKGVLDVSASSRDQFSWFSTDKGGWFTSAFVDSVLPSSYPQRNFVTWNMLLAQSGKEANATFHEQRNAAIKNPASWNKVTYQQITGQKDMLPQVFTNQVAIVR